MKQISDSPPVWLIVSIFHNVKCSVTNVTQTTAWCNLRESRSEVRVQFSRVYWSPSCSTSATCASQGEISPPPPNANVKAGAQTPVHVIYHWGSGLPHDKAEKTVGGGGEVRMRLEFPLKKVKLHKKNHQSPSVCMCVCVCVCRFVCVCIPERLPPFIAGPHFAFSCILSHQ